jgi:hypothetical protein
MLINEFVLRDAIIDESALRDAILTERHIHAFAIMGTNRESKFYFSHTPMFHNPVHTYQVIFEGEFDKNEDMEKYLEKREELRKKGERPDNAVIIANPNKLQSFEEILNIPNLNKGSFTGNGFEGLGFKNGNAFEQPPFMENVKINIKKVLLFQKLNPNTLDYPDFLTYYLYGNASELYISHLLSKAPNFEQEREIELLEPKNINFNSNIIKIEVPDINEKDNQPIREDPIKEERANGYKIIMRDDITGRIKFNKYQWIEINILNKPHHHHSSHNMEWSQF